MTGIILKTDTKANINTTDVTSGGIALTSDTDELVTNELGVLKYRKVKIDTTDAVSKNNGIPSGGNIGDLVLDTTIGEHKEYYKMNSWKTIYEGYSRDYLLTNFEPKVNIPSPNNFIRTDGTNSMEVGYDDSTLDSIITKAFVDLLANQDTSDVIKADGSRQMGIGYSPELDGDVITVKYLADGSAVIIPPTVEPTIGGAIWNDNGVLKITSA